jgi:hypothetical protein
MSRPIILWEVHCYCISLLAFFRSFGVSAAMQPRDDQSPLALSPLNVQMKRVTNVEKFLICKQKSPNIWIAMYKSVECVFCARFSFFILSLSRSNVRMCYWNIEWVCFTVLLQRDQTTAVSEFEWAWFLSFSPLVIFVATLSLPPSNFPWLA